MQSPRDAPLNPAIDSWWLFVHAQQSVDGDTTIIPPRRSNSSLDPSSYSTPSLLLRSDVYLGGLLHLPSTLWAEDSSDKSISGCVIGKAHQLRNNDPTILPPHLQSLASAVFFSIDTRQEKLPTNLPICLHQLVAG